MLKSSGFLIATFSGKEAICYKILQGNLKGPTYKGEKPINQDFPLDFLPMRVVLCDSSVLLGFCLES